MYVQLHEQGDFVISFTNMAVINHWTYSNRIINLFLKMKQIYLFIPMLCIWSVSNVYFFFSKELFFIIFGHILIVHFLSSSKIVPFSVKTSSQRRVNHTRENKEHEAHEKRVLINMHSSGDPTLKPAERERGTVEIGQRTVESVRVGVASQGQNHILAIRSFRKPHGLLVTRNDDSLFLSISVIILIPKLLFSSILWI